MKKALILLSFLSLNTLVFAQDGTLDNSFGSNGKVTTSVTSGNDMAQDILVQNDGKILVGGDVSFANTDSYIQLVRYNANGTLDNTFGNNGKVTTLFAQGSSGFKAMALQNDGKIVVVGFVNNKVGTAENLDFAIIRYNTNGSLDTSFDTDGKVTTDFNSVRDVAHAVAIQSDGKIVVAGDTRQGIYSHDILVRYDMTGALDASLNASGKVITPSYANENQKAYTIKVLADNKIIIASRVASSVQVGDLIGSRLIKYTNEGKLDLTFGRDGIKSDVFTQLPTHKILDNGKILIAGMDGSPFGSSFTITRLNADGEIDTSFGTNGKIKTLLSGYHTYTKDILVQNDGKIVLTAAFTDIGVVAPSLFFGLVRCKADGTLDNTFGMDGASIIRASLANERYVKSAIQTDGKIVSCGSFTETSNEVNLAVVRYNNTVVGIKNPIENTPLSIFPNPTTGILTIDFEKSIHAYELKLTDGIGRIAYQKNYDKSLPINSLSIQTGDLVAGLYVLTITTDKGIVSRIVSKQ